MDYLTAALIVFTLGIVLLGAEVLLPTGGILVVGALLFFALGVGIIFARGTTPEAVVALGALAIGLPTAGYVAVAAWRRMSLDTVLIEDGKTPPVPIPGLADLEALKNRTGKTVSPLRPSGTVEFDGRRVDAMTEGGMLDAGVWVRCVTIRSGTVIVRQMESPADVGDITPDAPRRPDVPDIDLGLSPPVPAPKPPPAASPPPAKKPADDDDLDLGLDK